jgi:hypothetical protein
VPDKSQYEKIAESVGLTKPASLADDYKTMTGGVSVTPEEVAAKKTLATQLSNEMIASDKAFRERVATIRQNASGQFGGAVEQEVRQAQREYDDQRADKAIAYNVAIGDYTSAKEGIDMLFNLRTKDIENDYSYKKSLVDSIYDDLTEKEKAQAELLKEQRAQEFELKKQDIQFERDKQLKKIGLGGGSGTSNQSTDNERALMSQFRGEQITKDYNEILGQKGTIDAYIQNGVGGPADLALVFSFMKGLDPNSVVRESEYETAAKSGNIFQGAFARFNGYFKEKGGILPENVKQEFQNLVNQKLKVKETQYNNLTKQYSDIAVRQGLNPKNVVIDYAGGASGTPMTVDQEYEEYLKADGKSKSSLDLSNLTAGPSSKRPIFNLGSFTSPLKK